MKLDNILFIVDTSKNSLTAQTTAHKDENGVIRCHYTGKETKTEFVKDGVHHIQYNFEELSFEDYNQENGGKFKVMTNNEFDEHLKKAHSSICGQWEEITIEKWEEMLECLPPMKWRDITHKINVFACMEAFTGNIHSFYLRDENTRKAFTAMFPINSTNEVIFSSYKSFLK